MHNDEVSRCTFRSSPCGRASSNSSASPSVSSNTGLGSQHLCLAESDHISVTSEGHLLTLATESSENTLSQSTNSVDGASCSKSEPATPVDRFHVDAVHPFFTSYRNIKYDKSTSTDNQTFYCGQCNVQIDLSQEAVNEHFSSLSHSPIDERCVYCHTPVYEYFYNENRYYYHRCPKEQPRQKQIDEGTSNKDSSNTTSSLPNTSTDTLN